MKLVCEAGYHSLLLAFCVIAVQSKSWWNLLKVVWSGDRCTPGVQYQYQLLFFCLKINSIVKSLPTSVACSLYVDDFLICYRSKHINIIERHLQQSLSKIEHWTNTSGFKFSSSKTVCMHFCHLRKPHPDPMLNLYGAAIPVVQEVKFLGLIFDSKLSFLPHLRYLKKKCIKALNLLLQVRFKCIIYCAQN